MRTAIVWILLFVFLVSDLFAAGRPPVVVDVTGFADIQGRSRERARERALNNAFRQAIEQVVGVMVTSKTEVQNSELLHDKIFSKSSGFIKTYAITGESFDNDACRLQVRATVSAARLRRGLGEAGVAIREMGKPRLALIVSEQNGANEPASTRDPSAGSGIAESVIQEVLEKKGYPLVDRETLVARARQEGIISAADAALPLAAATRLATEGGAEIMIIGQARAREAATPVAGTSMRSAQAQVTAKVVEADTGRIITSSSASGAAAHINPTTAAAEAIGKASRELAENLSRQILARWRLASGTRTAHLTIRGVEFADISRLRELMQQRLNSVEETLERGYRDGTLSLEVEINGTPRELAEEMGRTDLEGFRSRVLSFTGNTLSLRIVKIKK